MRKGQSYSDKFKETIIDIVLNSNKSITEISLELGLPDRILYNWRYIEKLTKNVIFLTLSQEKN